MLDADTRSAVLRLRKEGHGTRTIAKALGISRDAVKAILASGDPAPPDIERPSVYTPHVDRIRDLHVRCRGNLVRVHEELTAAGIVGGYATLTRFCRAHDIGTTPPKRVGTWDFAPGAEMQHDTSPHVVEIGGRRRTVQCASLVLFHSRMRFCQVYPTFNRFYAKAFLTEALVAFGGAAQRCMVDNTHVVVASGTGADAVVAPEMAAFAERFGFTFVAHALGYAERSGRVERPFHHVEHNFYPGRTFPDLRDLNAQLRVWCERYGTTHRRDLHASPLQLFQQERTALRPLPLHIPEVYAVEHRTVDTCGDVHLCSNRYSVPEALIGRQVEVLASLDRVRIVAGHRIVAEHVRLEDGAGGRSTIPGHRVTARRVQRAQPPVEETALDAAGPEFTAMIALLRRTRLGRAMKALRRLHRMYVDYPTDVLRTVLAEALEYGLSDLDRIERMVLRRLAGDFFRLPTDPETDDG